MMQFPMLYGDSFIEEYSELLSEETKGFFDDLFNDITIIPPALAKILDDEKPKGGADLIRNPNPYCKTHLCFLLRNALMDDQSCDRSQISQFRQLG